MNVECASAAAHGYGIALDAVCDPRDSIATGGRIRAGPPSTPTHNQVPADQHGARAGRQKIVQ